MTTTTKNVKATKSSTKATKPAGSAVAAPAPRARKTKDGLRKPLVDILNALSKAKGPLTRKEIAEKAPTDLAFLSTWLGAYDPAVRKANEAKRGVKGLLTLGYVKAKVDPENDEGRTVALYEITAAGRKALAAALKS